MNIKHHFNSLTNFGFFEAFAILVAMIARKVVESVPAYNLTAKTLFDFYGQRNIVVKRKGNQNVISYVSSYSGKNISFLIRRKTTDIVIFNEVLLMKSYSPLIDICTILNINPKNIVDGGANIGSFSVFIKDVYPDVKIISIEPEDKNLAQLRENIKLNNFDNIEIVNGGIWNTNEDLYIQNDFRGEKERELSFSLSKTKCNNVASRKIVKGFTIFSLMNQFDIHKIDILKIDIEGAEAYIFNSKKNIKSILDMTSILAIELHDECINRFDFIKNVEELGYKQITYGEITYVY